MIEPNYAVYRSQMINLNANIKETDIYIMWITFLYGEWKIHTNPIRGNDGEYHFIYISVCDDGRIYIGKHSTDNLDDGYQGSGTEVKKLRAAGHAFLTFPLEFCRTSEEALAREKDIVNTRFITESTELVLNKTIGGADGYEYYHKITCEQSSAQVEQKEVIPTMDNESNVKYDFSGILFDGDEVKDTLTGHIGKWIDVANLVVKFPGCDEMSAIEWMKFANHSPRHKFIDYFMDINSGKILNSLLVGETT